MTALALGIAPASAAIADTDAAVVEVVPSECPDGYSGVVLDFYTGEPPRHLFTLRLCQNLKP